MLFDFRNQNKLDNLASKGNQSINANNYAAQNLQNVINMLFTTPATPLVTVDQIILPQTIIAGQLETLRIYFVNSGAGEAQNIYLNVEPGTGMELSQAMPVFIGNIPSGQTVNSLIAFAVPGEDLNVFKLSGETICRIEINSENSQTRSKQVHLPYKANIGRIRFVINDDSDLLEDVFIEVKYSSALITSGSTDASGIWITAELYPEVYLVNLQKDGYNPIDIVVTVLAGDTLTINLAMQSIGHSYLPGNVNMSAGAWPPAATGPDVTYLVNFFRGVPTSHSCLLDGFWASADANGDCNIIGSDVTKLVNVFRGQGSIGFCADYPPAWPTPADLPAEAPEGWPNCETVTAGRVVPTAAGK